MKTSTGFWIEVGFSVKADPISQDELVRQLTEWAEEHHTLDGFTLESGESPIIKTVHFACGDC